MAKKQLVQATINSAVALVLTAAEKYQQRLEALRALVKGHDEKSARPVLLLATGKFYGVPLKVSESNANKGERVLDRDHENFEAAKKSHQRLMAALYPVSGKEQDDVVVPRAAQQYIDAGAHRWSVKVLRAALRQHEAAAKAKVAAKKAAKAK